VLETSVIDNTGTVSCNVALRHVHTTILVVEKQ